MEPVSRRPGFAPPETPLTRRLLVYFASGAYSVTESSVWNWESNESEPNWRYWPTIIEFLGYDPLPPADGLADQLVRYRRVCGLTQTDTAMRLSVDPSTLARWERGERQPAGKYLDLVNKVLRPG
jgi:DNA-binding transcriptional regulator YiaG